MCSLNDSITFLGNNTKPSAPTKKVSSHNHTTTCNTKSWGTSCKYQPRSGFIPFWALQIPWLSMSFSITLGLAVTVEKIFKTFLDLEYFVDLKQFNRKKLWHPQKCVTFVLFNYSSLSYIILALSSAVTNLPNKTLIIHDFQGPKSKFHEFPGLANEILKFHNSTGFPWPVSTSLQIMKNQHKQTKQRDPKNATLKEGGYSPNGGAC